MIKATTSRRAGVASAAFWTSLLISGCGGGGSEAPAAPDNIAPPRVLTGAVHMDPGSLLDSDGNDPEAARIPNDRFDTAQPVAAPAQVGGYVNVAGAGGDGVSKSSGDPRDVFRAELAAGMRVQLTFSSDAAGSDLDLYLYAEADTEQPVDAALGTGEQTSLTVPEDGSYYVVVAAYSGAATYSLAVGLERRSDSAPQNDTAHIAAHELRLSDDFIAGELVAQFKPRQQRHGPITTLAERVRARGLDLLAGIPGRPALLAVAAESAVSDGTLSLSRSRSIALASAPPGSAQRTRLETLLAVKALRADPDVDYAEPNYRRRLAALPNDTHYRWQWHYPLIRLPEAWDLVIGEHAAAPPVVAVVDTGVLSGHPDLKDVVLGDGYDFVRDPQQAGDGDGIDADPAEPSSTTGSFHGTHVAGTIAAKTANGTGVAGASWGARVLPLRAVGTDGGSSYDVQQALRYAAGLPNDSGKLPSRKADVINLSIGGGSPSQTEAQLITELRRRGIIVVGAAGNGGADTPFYPAAYDGVVAVGAVDAAKRQAPYSNFGAFLDVAAPGGDNARDDNDDGYGDGILSTSARLENGVLRYQYRFANGTSMAAPHVAGVIALMKTVAPSMTPQQFDELLGSGELTEDLGAPGRDDLFGHGLIDAHRAVWAAHALASGAYMPPPARLEASVQLLDFGAGLASLPVDVGNAGGGELGLTAIATSAAWLEVVPETVDASGLGRYRVGVDRRALAPGEYSATARFTSNANSVELQVLVVVRTPDNSTGGMHYVLLYEPASRTVVAQRTAEPGHQPSFAFDGVTDGSYFLFAGSDIDNDGLICELGEACGAYPRLEQPEPVSPSDVAGALSVTTRIHTEAPTAQAATTAWSLPMARLR